MQHLLASSHRIIKPSETLWLLGTSPKVNNVSTSEIMQHWSNSYYRERMTEILEMKRVKSRVFAAGSYRQCRIWLLGCHHRPKDGTESHDSRLYRPHDGEEVARPCRPIGISSLLKVIIYFTKLNRQIGWFSSPNFDTAHAQEHCLYPC